MSMMSISTPQPTTAPDSPHPMPPSMGRRPSPSGTFDRFPFRLPEFPMNVEPALCERTTFWLSMSFSCALDSLPSSPKTKVPKLLLKTLVSPVVTVRFEGFHKVSRVI